MTKADAMEHRIETAWCRLVGERKGKPITLYLTTRGGIAGWLGEQPEGSTEIGSYDSRAQLSDFRADVFFAWDSMTKGRAA